MTPTPKLSAAPMPRCETRFASLAASTSRVFEASAGDSPLADVQAPRATVGVEVKTYNIVTGMNPVSGFWSITFSADVFDAQQGRILPSRVVLHDISPLSEKQQRDLSNDDIWTTVNSKTSFAGSIQEHWQREVASFAKELSELSFFMEEMDKPSRSASSSGHESLDSLQEIVQRDLAKFATQRCAELVDASRAPTPPGGVALGSARSRISPVAKSA